VLRLSSIAWKLTALGASATLHVAVLATATSGHAAAGPALAVQDPSLEIEVKVDPIEPDVLSPVDVPAAHAHAPHWPTHTHPYPVPADHDATPHDPSLVHVFGGASPVPPSPQPSPEPVVAAPEAMPRFTVVVGAEPATGSATHAAGAAGPAVDVAGEGDPLPEQGVSSPARAVLRVLPVYPAEARGQGIEADVPLEIVVSATGAVESARPLQHAGLGLEAAAVNAIRQFRFAPAQHDGHPVRVRMRWTMQFRLQ
jgi:TonB family protein